MLSGPRKADAAGIKNQWHYERHRPEQSLLFGANTPWNRVRWTAVFVQLDLTP
jgi:hypothetical protein